MVSSVPSVGPELLDEETSWGQGRRGHGWRGLGGKTGQRVDGVTARPLQSWVSGGSLTPPAVAPPPSLAISWRRRVSDLGFASHQMATEANRLTTVHLHVYMLTGHLLHFRDLNLQITKALPR